MSRVLLDENVPIGLRMLLADHDVFTVENKGWKGLTNGRLLAAAETEGFEVLVTADQNLRFQRGDSKRAIALVILSTTKWRVIRSASRAIEGAIQRIEPGGHEVLDLEAPRRLSD